MLELDYRKFEALMTVLTLVWHVIRVNTHVGLQRSSISKRLAALIALIWSVQVMFPHVTFEVAFCEKLFGTHITRIWFLPRVLSVRVVC